ncbi:hypothetical protein GGI25_006061 [Coemansia spiralis]|uniref:Uncharacterized protein n=2 Tax=Coemansia TaxID=4863 RepID=A0A9W8G2Y4_9FUNG|nr:hypothetical protein EDC05_006051 [Coemansia umbellata]KAJ2618986.1 hypothetical protein GGI26_006201 [Coemansia sp. RSA 1358]KAJ2669699.1 hypothetical protein GGI25_006061 [Coemansia spiralis]
MDTDKRKRFWPRLFSLSRKHTKSPTHGEEPAPIAAPRPAATESGWAGRPYAHSSASAATAVAMPGEYTEPTGITPDSTLSSANALLLHAPMLDMETHIVTAQELAAANNALAPNKTQKSRRLRRRATKQSQKNAVEQFPASEIVAVTSSTQNKNQHLSWADDTEKQGKSASKGDVHMQADAEDRAAQYSAAAESNREHGGIEDDESEHVADAFWNAYDRRISQGSEATKPRAIIDAMLDDIVTLAGGIDGWRVVEGRGTFNDVLGNVAAIHPIVLTFARAHVENAFVCLGAEHIWLAVLQGVSAMLRKCDAHTVAPVVPEPASTDDGGGKGAVDLMGLWRALRSSSDVPAACVAKSGHEIRLFASDINGRHLVYPSHGAAPVTMAAAVAGHHGAVKYGHISIGGRAVSWQPRRRSTNPAWIQALASGPGVRGLCLTGSLQGWSSLCMLARQLKETYAGRSRTFDWWLHRMHLLCCDLADYFAAQEEFAEHGVPREWQQWFSMALFDGHSGAPRGSRMDGWLSALFALDAHGMALHQKERWWMEWEAVPSGVDLLRVPHGAQTLNMYSGFVGVQQLCRDVGPLRSRNQSRTLQGEDLEAAFGLARDRASTLNSTASRDHTAVANELDLDAAPEPLQAEAPGIALAPVIGWALDK